MYLTEVEQNMILEPEQPLRASIEEGPLVELAESIRQLGLLQPLVVRKSGDKFEVIAGHRRLLATRMVGLPRAQCLVVMVIPMMRLLRRVCTKTFIGRIYRRWKKLRSMPSFLRSCLMWMLSLSW